MSKIQLQVGKRYVRRIAKGKDTAATCSEIIKFADKAPPNDYDYDCVIVFKDGYETKSNGGTVHDCCVKSSIAYGWRRYITNKYL